MGKKSFPDTQLKLVQKINNEHARDVKIAAKFINKCILRMEHKAWINKYLETWLTSVGTEEVALRRRLTTAPAMAAADL